MNPHKAALRMLAAGTVTLGAGFWCAMSAAPGLGKTAGGLIGLIGGTVLMALLHEYAHFVAAKLLRVQQLRLCIDNFRFYVEYDAPDKPLSVAGISIAGPLSGTVAGVLLMWLSTVVPRDVGTWIMFIGVLAVLQALFLLPFAADGYALFQSLKMSLSNRRRQTQ